MNWDQIQGNWKQFTARVKQKWAKLTDDDLALIGGKRDELLGKIQERVWLREGPGREGSRRIYSRLSRTKGT